MALEPALRRVAVIIPARDAAGSLSSCLAALRLEGVPGTSAALIVVDDGSVDATASVAASFGATVLHCDGRGPATARNMGASATDSDILVFLDADTAPTPGWLAAMLEPFAEPDVVGVKGRYVTHQRGIVPRFAQLEFEEKYARLERARRIDFVDTGTAAYLRSVFVEAGGFDEMFPIPSAEDVELAFRIAQERGACFAFSPSACVRHTHARDLATYLRKKAIYGFFRVTVYRRFPSKLKGDSYTPPWLGLQIFLSGLLPLTLLGALAGLPAWVVASTALLFGASCLPLLRRAPRADRGLLPWVIPLCLLRSLAQGLGLAAGLLASLSRSHRATGRLQQRPQTR